MAGGITAVDTSGKRGIREFFLTDSNKGLVNIPETMAVKNHELLNKM
ncbi:MAG: hypothetical protein ACLVB1_03160 [Blautia obeum]